jgi:hypothetical protein
MLVCHNACRSAMSIYHLILWNRKSNTEINQIWNFPESFFFTCHFVFLTVRKDRLQTCWSLTLVIWGQYACIATLSYKFCYLYLQTGPKVTSLVAGARQVRATFAWYTGSMTHIVRKFCANICVTYAPDVRHIQESDAKVPRTIERATRDVTFGPFCLYGYFVEN